MTSINHVTDLFIFHDVSFINAIYKALLDRAPDPEGMNYYLERLSSGHGKSQIIAQLASSKEAKLKNVKLAGLESLLIEQKKSGRWFFNKSNRQTTVQINLLEVQLGRLTEEIAQIRQESMNRTSDLEAIIQGNLLPSQTSAHLRTTAPHSKQSEAIGNSNLGKQAARHLSLIKRSLMSKTNNQG